MTSSPRSLQDWLVWQERLNPRDVDLGLERLRPVARVMGLDRLELPVITVAGTNGKGSVVTCLESLCLSHGLRVGCYLSPWLLHYNETVRVAGEAMDDARLMASFRQVEDARGDVPLTAFEFRTLAAVNALRAEGAEVLVLEVGLGGRLDAVNLFDAQVALITSIGLDHGEWLGDTLEQVAREKAGIARRGRPLVCCDPRAGALVSAACAPHGARVLRAGEDYRFGTGSRGWWLRAEELSLEDLAAPALRGPHQYANAAGAIVAFALTGLAQPQPRAVSSALRQLSLPGRLQRLEPGRERFVDVAHNPQAAAALAAGLDELTTGAIPLHAVCAMYGDKDVEGTLAALGERVSCWYVAPLPPPRGACATRLMNSLERLPGRATARAFPDVASAWQAANEAAGSKGRVLAFGSFETARRVLQLESAVGRLDT